MFGQILILNENFESMLLYEDELILEWLDPE